MKKLISIAVICLPLLMMGCKPHTVINTNNTLSGFVYDDATFQPIQGATLTLTPGEKTCVTGSDGHFSFQEKFSDGKYKVAVTATGYRSDWKSNVKLYAGENTEITFMLKKEE